MKLVPNRLIPASRVMTAALCIAFPLHPGGAEPSAVPGSELFADGAVCLIRLEISPEGLKSLRTDPRQYVRATLREGTNVLRDIAVRLKGSTGSFRRVDDKPAFTVNGDHFTAGQRLHGLSKIHLNNSVEDPSYLNEKLGSELFRAAGVPAPRVSHARVELNGRKLGLYVLKEGFAIEFLEQHFQRTDGNLYEAEAGKVSDVTGLMKRNSGSGAADGSDLQRLVVALPETDPSRRWTALGEALDLNRFLAFMAMEVLSGHRDGYCLARNNFRLYHDPTSDRFVFLPDGMDQLFGRSDFPVQPRMSGLVAKAVIETPAGRRAYRERMTILLTNCFKIEALTNRVHEWGVALARNLTRTEARMLQRETTDLCERIRQRIVDVTRQLAAPEPAFVRFENGIARLCGWRATDDDAGAKLERTTRPGRPTLHIQAQSEALPSWRTKVWLQAGRYRFEGLARTAGVKPRAFGKNHGASLIVWGRKGSGASLLVGDTDWTKLQVEFEVSEREAQIELVCALRAGEGSAWFDEDSLQLVRLEPKDP